MRVEDATIVERPPKRNLIGRRNFLTRATLAGAVTLAPSLANAGSSDPAEDAQLPSVNPAKPMPETVTAEEIRTLLKRAERHLRFRARDL